MDSFDELLNEVSQKSQDDGMSFDDALLCVLMDDDAAQTQEGESTAEGLPSPQAAGYRVPVVTLDHLVQAIKKLVPVQIDTVLSAGSWHAAEDGSGLYSYRFEDAAFAEHKRTEMYVAMSCADSAANAGIYPITETQNGYVQILSRDVPDADIAVTFLVRVIRQNTYA